MLIQKTGIEYKVQGFHFRVTLQVPLLVTSGLWVGLSTELGMYPAIDD